MGSVSHASTPRTTRSRNSMMNDMIVCFDCSGTLVDYNDKPQPAVIAMLRGFKAAGYRVVVWSGGGIDFARNIVNFCGITDAVDVISAKTTTIIPDVTVDDEKIYSGRLQNIQIRGGCA